MEIQYILFIILVAVIAYKVLNMREVIEGYYPWWRRSYPWWNRRWRYPYYNYRHYPYYAGDMYTYY